MKIRPLTTYSLCSALIYGLLYPFLTVYPAIFRGLHAFKPGVRDLPELGALLGVSLTTAIMIIRQPMYRSKLITNNNVLTGMTIIRSND